MLVEGERMIDKNVRCSVSFLGKCFLILLLVCTSWLSSSGLSTVQVTWAADNSNQLKPKGFEDINLHTLVDIDQDNISSLEKPEHAFIVILPNSERREVKAAYMEVDGGSLYFNDEDRETILAFGPGHWVWAERVQSNEGNS